MSPLRIGIATQTPLLRADAHERAAAAPRHSSTGVRHLAERLHLLPWEPEAAPPEPATTRLSDFNVSPGGVSRMVLQSVRAWQAAGRAGAVHWFCLQPAGPRRLRLEDVGIELHHLSLPPEQLGAYARTKEKLWADIHGLASPGFDVEDFRFYARYNGLASDAILQEAPNLDVAYVHDFQLLQVGAIVGLAAPSVLRWHVPFDPARMPQRTRRFLLRMMEAYQGIVVSTRRELEGLTNAGYRGRVRQIYPHSEPAAPAVPPHAVQDLEDHLGLQPGQPMLLCVARMDPMKRQDLLIEAMALLRRSHPDAALVLVGNGSFSASVGGGLGLGKAHDWRAHLEDLALRLDVEGAVRLAGWLPDAMVAAAYARADALVLPSDVEGFGLTPFEAWAHGKPCVVSSGCGCAEVVQDGVTGLVFPPGRADRLARCLDDLLSHRDKADRMGEAGRQVLRNHGATRSAEKEAGFLEEAIERFGRTP